MNDLNEFINQQFRDGMLDESLNENPEGDVDAFDYVDCSKKNNPKQLKKMTKSQKNLKK